MNISYKCMFTAEKADMKSSQRMTFDIMYCTYFMKIFI